MWYYHRTFQEDTEDFKAMGSFLCYLNKLHLCDWTVGRLFAWKYGRWNKESQDPIQFSKQAELFYNYYGRLCGILITEDFGENYFLLSEKNEFVIQEMVEFLKEGGNFNRPYAVNVISTDTSLIRVLKKNGFTYSGEADTTYVYLANAICFPSVALPEGFALASQQEFTDAHKAELLRYYAFNPTRSYNDVFDFAYMYARTNPLLDPELAILLLNEEGEPISTCTGYLDRENLTMEVEVVATKKEYENKGYAKAVIAECIRRGIAKGVTEISISGWNEKTRKLYSSFGACEMIEKANYILNS